MSLIGAPSDPQDLTRQAGQLRAAGAHVFASNAAAARFAVRVAIARQAMTELLRREPHVISAGRRPARRRAERRRPRG